MAVDMKAKRREKVEEAEKALRDALEGKAIEDVVTIPDPVTSTDEPTAIEPQADTTPTSEEPTEKQEPDTSANDKLQAEISSLKAELKRATDILSDENSQTYKSRWEALKGQFQGKSQKVDELTEKVAKLEAKIEQLSSAPSAPEPKMEEDPEYLADIEDGLGPRQATLNYQFRQKMKMIEGKVGGVDEAIKATKGKAEEIEAKAKELETYQYANIAEKYAVAEATAVPDWDSLMGTEAMNFSDQNPKFTEFLGLVVRGKTNLQWLKDFKDKYDVQGVKEVFDAGRSYVGEKAVKTKPSDKAAKYIEPDQTASRSLDVVDTTPKPLKRSEIREFQRQIRTKQYKGTQAEREVFQNRMANAILTQSVIEDI